MGKVTKILSPVLGLLGLDTEAPDIPTPEIAAAPAPARRTDTGAKVVTGSDAVKNQRVSDGTRKKSTLSSGSDPLSGLGQGGGLNI